MTPFNPSWISAGLAVAGLVVNATWTAANLVMSAKIVRKIDSLKLWADARFVRKEQDDEPALMPVRRRAPHW
jgi:hypothetical protein